MFRTAAKKIAHNSTIPSLGGKKDLRTLQDMIIAEKGILTSLQKLGADLMRASEALRIWGVGEGDDLSDVLGASCTLYSQFADAIAVFANNEITVRDHMKSIRSREERLDDLRRRRKSLASDADSAEKKLSKMSPDNKHLQAQTDNLNKLREEIKIMDMDIMAEEASLGDYKRTTVKAWMGLKFGGLVECCEKGIIVGEIGKFVIAEIPLEPTEPGMPRVFYQGQQRTESLVAEARRALSDVAFSSEPGSEGSHRPPHSFPSPELPSAPNSLREAPNPYGPLGGNSQRNSIVSGLSQLPTAPEETSDNEPNRSPLANYAAFPQPPQPSFLQNNATAQSLSYEKIQTPTSPTTTMSEFGVGMPEPFTSRSMRNSEDRERLASPKTTRFSTFPMKAAGPRPVPGISGDQRESQLHQVTSRLSDDRPPSLNLEQPDDSFSSSVAQALAQQLKNDTSQNVEPLASPPPPPRMSPPRLPRESPTEKKRESEGLGRDRSYSSPPPRYSITTEQREKDESKEDAIQEEAIHTAQQQETPPVENKTSPDVDSGNRKVNFENTPNLQEAPEPLTEQASDDVHNAQRIIGHLQTDLTTNEQQEVDTQEFVRAESRSLPQILALQAHPPREPSPVDDEAALNAVAAREVSRELDSFMFNTSAAPPSSPPYSPLAPPRTTFATHSVSSRPDIEYGSQPSSPMATTQYMRERDRSLASPTTASSDGTADETIPPLTERCSIDRVAAASPPLPIVNISTGSRTTSYSSTVYRTPPENASSSMYNLPPTSIGSGVSFSSQPGKISAAAFRRQQLRSPSLPRAENGPAPATGPIPPVPPPVDVSPLHVKKRPLPYSPTLPPQPPYQNQVYPMQRRPSAPPSGSSSFAQDTGDSGVRYRSASTAGSTATGRDIRFSWSDSPGHQDVAGSEEEFDYISAYVDSSAKPSRDEHRVSGYAQGRFATNLEEEEDGLR